MRELTKYGKKNILLSLFKGLFLRRKGFILIPVLTNLKDTDLSSEEQ